MHIITVKIDRNCNNTIICNVQQSHWVTDAIHTVFFSLFKVSISISISIFYFNYAVKSTENSICLINVTKSLKSWDGQK